MADEAKPKPHLKPEAGLTFDVMAGILSKAAVGDKRVVQVTPPVPAGARNPKAVFTVITENGGVMRVEVKRLIAGA
jgi:hypothetical protein